MKRARARRRYTVACCAVALVAIARVGHAAPSATEIEEAKKHYARGVQLYNQGADTAALAELERAYELAPNWKVLYNLGLVQLLMNDFAAALQSFEQFLADGGAQVGAARRAEVVGRIAKLRDQVATIDVSVTGAPDADLALDDVAVGQAPLAKPLVVNPGHHKIRASKTGRMPETKVVSVTGGDHAKVEIALEEPPPPAPVPAASPPEPEPILVSRPAPTNGAPVTPPPAAEPARTPRGVWIGWVTTGALASGAIVTGLVALNANSQLTHAKADGPAPADQLDRLSTRAHSFALASDIMTGGAIVAGGVTLFLMLRHPEAPSPPSGMARVGASVGVDLGPASVAVHGAF